MLPRLVKRKDGELMKFWHKKNGRILVILMAIVAVLLGGCVWYINDYYHVTDRDSAMSDTSIVKVVKTSSGYLYDGPGEDIALIFYPGAKVQDIAYAPLLKELAENGVDCYLVHMPGNLAIFGVDKAEEVLEQIAEEKRNYEHRYLAGHSLGGAMAASFAATHSEELEGLIFLGAYSTEDLSGTDLRVLSLYGSEDQVLNREKLTQSHALMPVDFTEYVIEGGNHAQYGDYGVQKGDGTAMITPEQQRKITVEKILTFLSE